MFILLILIMDGPMPSIVGLYRLAIQTPLHSATCTKKLDYLQKFEEIQENPLLGLYSQSFAPTVP
jgi:hypothetical protein